MKVLLTGTNKGFGASICAAFQERGVEVVSLNRKSSGESGGGAYYSDFENLENLELVMKSLSEDNRDLDAVILNAGVLGPLGATSRIPLAELEQVLKVNFYANKVIADVLINNTNVKSFIQISSGASERVYEKWAAYGLSKMLLRRLFDFYRLEHTGRNFVVVSPGALATGMNAEIRSANNLDVEWMTKFENPSKLGSAEVMGSRLVELFLAGGLPSSEILFDLCAD